MFHTCFSILVVTRCYSQKHNRHLAMASEMSHLKLHVRCVIVFGLVLPWIGSYGQELPNRFQVEDLSWVNLYKATSLFPENQCAGSAIIHRAYGKCQGNLGIFIIPHKVIFHDGVRCGTEKSDEYMLLVPSERIANAQTAAFNNLLTLYAILAANERAINAFRVLNGIDPIYVGFELTRDRVCGTNVIPQNSVYLFITPGRNDINFGFAYLGRAELGMVVVRPDEQLCMYKQSRRLGPGQPEFGTPTPSPTATNYNLDHSLFIFDNMEGVPTCFPAHGIDAARPSLSPTSSITPTASFSSSISPSTSVTSTPTISNNAQTMSAIATVSSSAGQISADSSSTASASIQGLEQSQLATSSPSPTWTASATAVLGGTNLISPSNYSSTSGSPIAVISASQSAITTVTLSVSGSPVDTVTMTPSGIEQTSQPSVSPVNSSEPETLCFPTNATVELLTGAVVKMSELKVGDQVLVGERKFSPVIMFTHRDFNTWENFVGIQTSSKMKLVLSRSHYLPSGGTLKTAQELKVGDHVTLGDGNEDKVVSKWWITEQGLHNPHTLDGTIVVNGILTSTFTRAIAPICATGLLTPVRGLYRLGGSSWMIDTMLEVMQTFVMRVGHRIFQVKNRKFKEGINLKGKAE